MQKLFHEGRPRKMHIKKGFEILMAKKDFEKSIDELEKIVTELENGNLNLEDSISLFEKGIKISKECGEILENAEKRITILLNDGDEIKEEKFEEEQ